MQSYIQKKRILSAILTLLLFSFSHSFCFGIFSFFGRVKETTKAGAKEGLKEGAKTGALAGLLMGAEGHQKYNNYIIAQNDLLLTPTTGTLMYGGEFAAFGIVNGLGIGVVAAMTTSDAEIAKKRAGNLTTWSTRGLAIGYIINKLGNSESELRILGYTTGLAIGIIECAASELTHKPKEEKKQKESKSESLKNLLSFR